MNVYLYLALVIISGLLGAYFFGRIKSRLSAAAAAFQFSFVSFFFGIFLAFPLLQLVGLLCFYVGGIPDPGKCIRTDQSSVWYLAAPFVVFPAYIACMFIGRRIAREKDPSGSLTR
jgi:hypothetical protein